MSFRKRNVGISGSTRGGPIETPVQKANVHVPGVRPSPIDGRPTTSTGTASLDGILAGHSGFALGASILIEESGTTDYAGALLRFFAAEGLVQGHHVHVVGLPEQWGRELPGVVGEPEIGKPKAGASSEKMKIAWRYERLGLHGSDSVSRERVITSNPTTPEQAPGTAAPIPTFCHTFDLTKRLVHPPEAHLTFISLDPNLERPPFSPIIAKLSASIAASPTDTIHRIVIPSLLSPALYPPKCSEPSNILRFQHQLKGTLAKYPSRVCLMQSLSVSLYPRSTGFTRWIELLNDGVIELAPFPHSSDAEFQASRDPSTKEEPPQGMLQIHRLPVFHDRGSGVLPSESDWTFTLSRRKFTIKPYNLPPVEGDTEAQQTAADESKEGDKKADLEF